VLLGLLDADAPQPQSHELMTTIIDRGTLARV
jgi:hypothetical protein